MPVAMEMALLLLFFGGSWGQVLNTSPGSMSAPRTSAPIADISANSNPVTTMGSLKVGSREGHTLIPTSSISFTISEKATPLGTYLPVPESTAFQSISTKKPLVFLETSNTASDPAVSITMNSLGPHTGASETVTTSSLEIFNGMHGPPVTRATSSLDTSNETSGPLIIKAPSSPETSNETSGPPVTMATSSPETSNETSGLPVTMAPSSPEASNETSGLPVTIATSSLDTSNGTSGPPIIKARSSPETSNETSGPPVTMATSSPETSNETSEPSVSKAPSSPETRTSSSTVSEVKTSTTVTSKASTNSTASGNPSSDQGVNGSLLVAVFVALLVVTVLVALLLLWRHRQKKRTGALMLNRAGKRNGVVDAWAGPARVPDEEVATATVGESRGDKRSGVPEAEATGRRPTLTTFFGRRKSHPGSLALEELEAGPAPSPHGEKEPLVGGKDGASDGPETEDGSASQGP
ncbi:leukosialin [Choloepus didactylus]|uniref:leukosialin n=1 Tax=Choloepus didactylus TaxID=27675 RepID=UPI00189E96E6|nr:leukosialin [Choloepus didactylus]